MIDSNVNDSSNGLARENASMLSDEDRDHADLLFVRTRSGNPERQKEAWQALQAWAQDAERQRYLERLMRADVVMDRLAAKPAPVVPLRSRTRRWLPLATAASLVLLLGGTWWVNPTLSSEHYSAAIGEQREVNLADGSRVVLNTDSELTFDNRLRSRETRLLRGEALFEVEHGELRPFYVRSSDTQVRVVGTLFSVRGLDAGSRVAVANGRVEVLPKDETAPRILSAGQRVDTSGGRFAGDTETVDALAVSDWSQGRLVFDQVPLKSALAELQRYRQGRIILADQRLGELKLTGSFGVRAPDQALRMLQDVFPVKVAIANDGTARISRR